MVEKLKMLPFEFVVRGYLFGNMWKAYEKGESFCGCTLPRGYQLAQRLQEPVITPAVKHSAGHDEYVNWKQVESQLGAEAVGQIMDICFQLYDSCSRYALSKGLIIADAKFEFGRNGKGELVLADEIFTPDSSRFWSAADYKPGVSPRSFDKQLLRDWLLNNRVKGEFLFDRVPRDILTQTEQIYGRCLEMLVG